MRFIPGQKVVLPGGVFGTVVGGDEFGTRVSSSPGGAVSRYQTYEVKTRAQALFHWHHMTTQLARDLGDQGLEDAMEQAAVWVERAAQQCDAADAVRGLSS